MMNMKKLSWRTLQRVAAVGLCGYGLAWAGEASPERPAEDVTEQLVSLGVPLAGRYPGGRSVYARNPWDLHVHEGRLYIGGGNSSNMGPAGNAGPVPVLCFDPATDGVEEVFRVDDEQIDLFHTFAGRLFVPGHDARESWSLGNVYLREPDGGWKKRRTVPRAMHVYALGWHDGQLFAGGSVTRDSKDGLPVGAAAFRSDDLGQTWQAYELGLNRIHSLMKVRGRLFAIDVLRSRSMKAAIKGRLGKDTGEVFEYRGPAEGFVAREDIAFEELFPDHATSHFHLNSGKLVKPVSCGDAAVFIGAFPHNDHQFLPVGLFVAESLDPGDIRVRPATLPYDQDRDWRVWDLMERDGRLHAMAGREDGDEWINVVYRSDDAVTWKECLRFRTPTFARSFERLGDDWYFALGCEIARPQVWSDHEIHPATGTLLRYRPSPRAAVPDQETPMHIPEPLLTRRQAVGSIAAVTAASAAHFAAAAETASAGSDLIRVENALPGAADWQLTRVRLDSLDGCRSPRIEGYCSQQSVAAGEALDIMVSTDPPLPFRIEIFRLGYYGGRGARLMKAIGPFPGTVQPTPPAGPRSVRECRWVPSTSVTIPSDWPSGVYLGRLSLEPPNENQGGWQSYVVFIVRDDRPADILFQCSDNTWQAYNLWPAKDSIYTHPRGAQGPWADVSFDRPYGREAQFRSIVNDPLTVGSGAFLPFEFPLAYFLEQHGYDVSYCSNRDMLDPRRGRKSKCFISVGHDEYWDRRAFDNVVQLRDAGVSLFFLSGNAVCWVSPMKPSSDGRPDRVIFRGGPYGGSHRHAETREKQHGPFPERGPDEGLLMGGRNVEPVNGGGDWIVTRPGHWMFEGTGMREGDRIPGLVGWEYHGDPPGEIPGLEIVAAGTALSGGDRPQRWTATIYPGPSGNFVFNAATIFWAQGLSSPPGHVLPWSHWSRPHGPDERVQRITHNLLRRAIARPSRGESG